jgi:YfiH family protein
VNRVRYDTSALRHGPLRAPTALRRYLKRQKLPLAIATAEQVHRDRIVVVPSLRQSHEYPGADGLLTDANDQPLGIFTADCVPVFLSVNEGDIVGALHAGWRGVQQKILLKAFALIRKRWGQPAHRVRVWAGPAIGLCCFEVGWDVARHFPKCRRRDKRSRRWFVDLTAALERQVKRAGALWRRTAPLCTKHGDTHFSYRGGAITERQVSWIMKNVKP